MFHHRSRFMTYGDFQSGPNFMALLTVSTELALTEAGNSMLTSSVFHSLTGNFGAGVLHVTRHSMLTRLVQKWTLHISG